MSRNILLLFIVLFASSLAPAPAWPKTSPSASQLLSQGDTFAAHKDLAKAMDAYHKADKLSHHACAECDLRMFAVERQVGDFSSALDNAKHAVKVAGNDMEIAAEAHLVRGALLSSLASKPNDKKLKEAEEDFRACIEMSPSRAVAHFDLGMDLLKQERNTEGIAELNSYMAAAGAEPKLVKMAHDAIANPLRAREPFAPDFSFATLEGNTISTAELRGTVVLLDFWGTWCPPCRESVPSLVSIRKKFNGRPVQIVGISSDNDEQAWKEFVASHHMDWPQYIDLSGNVQELFDVHSYPTYIVLDRDGVIRFRQSGFDTVTDMAIENAINKSLKRPTTMTTAAH